MEFEYIKWLSGIWKCMKILWVVTTMAITSEPWNIPFWRGSHDGVTWSTFNLFRSSQLQNAVQGQVSLLLGVRPNVALSHTREMHEAENDDKIQVPDCWAGTHSHTTRPGSFVSYRLGVYVCVLVCLCVCTHLGVLTPGSRGVAVDRVATGALPQGLWRGRLVRVVTALLHHGLSLQALQGQRWARAFV